MPRGVAVGQRQRQSYLAQSSREIQNRQWRQMHSARND